jgi:hypothetical protein
MCPLQREVQRPAAGCIAVDDQDAFAVGISRQVGDEDGDDGKGGQNPAVAAVFLRAGAQVSARKEGGDREPKRRNS